VTPTVTLFTRTQCSLCDKAKAALEAVRASHPFDLVTIDLDVDADAEKRAAYDQEVPVIELDGRKIMKFRVDQARLARLLDARTDGLADSDDPA
jgi:glutaredoxin